MLSYKQIKIETRLPVKWLEPELFKFRKKNLYRYRAVKANHESELHPFNPPDLPQQTKNFNLPLFTALLLGDN